MTLNDVFSLVFICIIVIALIEFIIEKPTSKKENKPMKETKDLKNKIIALMKDSHVSADDGIENFADKLIELFDKEKKNMANNITNKIMETNHTK